MTSVTIHWNLDPKQPALGAQSGEQIVERFESQSNVKFALQTVDLGATEKALQEIKAIKAIKFDVRIV